jgi:carbamoyl-phosphate synthase large subunit
MTLVVLVTAGGCPGFAGVVKSLRMAFPDVRIIGTDTRLEVYGRLLVDKFRVVPPGNDQDYVPKILEFCKKEKVDVILPLTDFEIMALSEYAKKLEEHGFQLALSDYKFIKLTHDKALFYKAVEKFVDVPKYRLVSTSQKMKAFAQEMNYPQNQICMKPPIGRGSRGFFILTEEGSLWDKERRQVSLDFAQNLVTKSEDGMLVMEYVEGPEYSVDLFVSNERIFAICQRIRVQTRQGISYVGEIVDNNEVRLLCDKLITRLNVEGWGVRGNLNIQVRGEPPKLLEVNPRLSGSCVMCTYAGVNFPEIAVHYAMGWDLPSNQHPRIGTRIYRHWDEEVEFPRE